MPVNTEEKVTISVYPETEKMIYDAISKFEEAEDAKRELKENEFFNQFIDQMGITPLDTPETKPMSFADVVHIALITYNIVSALHNSTQIRADDIKRLVELMCEKDGIFD